MNVKMLADIFGVIVEMMMLAYFYRSILGASSYNKSVLRATYLGNGLLALVIASCLKEALHRTLSGFLVNFWPLWLYKGKIVTKVTLAAIFLVVQLAGEMVAWALLSALTLQGGDSYDSHAVTNYIQGILLSKLLAFLILKMLISIKKAEDYQQSPRWIVIYLLMPLTSIFVIYQLAYAASVIQVNRVYHNLLLTIVLLIIANGILFYLFDNSLERLELKQRERLNQRQIKLQKDFYQQITGKDLAVKKMHHDLHNHFALIMTHLEQGNTQKAYGYLQDLQVQSQSTIYQFTGNETLDAIFSLKKEQAQTKHISIRYQINMESPLVVNDMDLVIVFANGLDNAIEAVTSLTKAVDKIIDLTLQVDQHHLTAQIINPVQQLVKPDAQGHFQTGKIDSTQHGYGLSNIQETVAKYQGTATVTCDNQQFILAILMENKPI